MLKNLLPTRSIRFALSACLLLGCSTDEGSRPSTRTVTADASIADASIADTSTADASTADSAIADSAAQGWGGGGDGAVRPIAAIVRDYVDAWNSPDEAARRALLASSFAADGEYTDSAPTRSSSRTALVGVIGAFQAIFPNGQLAQTSGVDAIDNQFRFTWKVVLTDGSTAQTGEDQGEVGSDGLIRRITGFYDPDATGSTPDAIAALTRALSAGDGASRSNDLGAAFAVGILWGDRWMGAAGIPDLEAHFNDWVPPGTGTFTIAGGVGQHDDRFRVTFRITGGKVSANSQLFGHLDSNGLIDVAIFFDGDLPAL